MANDVTKDPSPKSDIVEDIILWRRKKLAISILSVSTSTWILLNFYGFTTITIISWIGIAVVSMVFLWGNLLRLLSKVEPELSGLEVSEEFVVETVRSCRILMEEMVRWMFRVGAESQGRPTAKAQQANALGSKNCIKYHWAGTAESEWFVFARTVLGFWVLSRIGNLLDFHTCLFIGLVMGLTVPKLWGKYGDQIQKQLGSLKDKSKGAYNTTHEKILLMKNKLHHGTEEKVKKSD